MTDTHQNTSSVTFLNAEFIYNSVLKSVDHTVIIMSNYLDSHALPKGFVLVLQNLEREKPANEHTHIIISETNTQSLILKVINRILPGTIPTLYATRCMKEARDLLRQILETSAPV